MEISGQAILPKQMAFGRFKISLHKQSRLVGNSRFKTLCTWMPSLISTSEGGTFRTSALPCPKSMGAPGNQSKFWDVESF